MKIAITGGAGYVGSRLVPRLLDKGHSVTVLDKFWFGDNLPTNDRLRKIKGDIRNVMDLKLAFQGQDAVIHLACVSNDPSFDMNPSLGRDINYSCFADILRMIDHERVQKFIYASSSSVYGVSNLADVTEDSICAPITDYSKYKLACEALLKMRGCGAQWTIIRPATVCGMAPRMRLDLVVNILTLHALFKNKITLLGKHQKRPNINIEDMCGAYEFVLDTRSALVDRQTFNVGFENLSIVQIAELVKMVVDNDAIQIVEEPTNDPRSYHINSDLIKRAGFEPSWTIEGAIKSIKDERHLLIDPLNYANYYNIKRMKELGL